MLTLIIVFSGHWLAGPARIVDPEGGRMPILWITLPLRNMLRSHLWINLCTDRGNGLATWPASRCARSCTALRNMLRTFPGISSKNA
ncbi:hypothetical protein, partial [Pseudomonas fluorescens]|uniref:hypothetical protein n=1 Tax=Pseudomonas fluorescens TaxID=294 RepID=UPI001F385BD4